MLRYIFMNLSDKPSEKVSSHLLLGVRALITAIALSVASSCAPVKNAHSIDQMVQKSEVGEWDIDSKEYCALVQTTAYIQAWIWYMSEMQSLWNIKKFVEEEMQSQNIWGKVTVSLCDSIGDNKQVSKYIKVHVENVWAVEIYFNQNYIATIRANDEFYYPGVKF